MLRKRWFLVSILISILIIGTIYYWHATQPIYISSPIPTSHKSIEKLPKRNQAIIEYIENQGKNLAPTYQSVVCTDYVINVLSHFYKLSKSEKRAIQIITEENLMTLVEKDAVIIKGIYTALLDSGKGVAVSKNQVQAGDFVQFWNIIGNSCYGHCGIVKAIDNETITMYSSHPITNGFGIHTFRYPTKAYFVRLK